MGGSYKTHEKYKCIYIHILYTLYMTNNQRGQGLGINFESDT